MSPSSVSDDIEMPEVRLDGARTIGVMHGGVASCMVRPRVRG